MFSKVCASKAFRLWYGEHSSVLQMSPWHICREALSLLHLPEIKKRPEHNSTARLSRSESSWTQTSPALLTDTGSISQSLATIASTCLSHRCQTLNESSNHLIGYSNNYQTARTQSLTETMDHLVSPL